MKASTLFLLALALLVGLGSMVAVKCSGLLNPPEKKAEAPPPAPPPPPNILVAARNLFAGDAISATDVRLRPLQPDEFAAYEKNQPNFLPVPEAAVLRSANKNIEANQPITKDLLEPMSKPEPLRSRLPPLTRAIDLKVEVENSAAALIQVEDWVDVYLTSVVGRSDGGESSVRMALLARNVQVVAKRGTLYKTYAPLPPGPVQFTLAPNLYRAALVDYARNKGVLTLHPVSVSEKEKLDALKAGLDEDAERVVALSLDPSCDEFQEELRRVRANDRGAGAVGDEDLVRVFGLKPLAPPAPPVTVEYYHGVQSMGGAAFTPTECGLIPYNGPEKAGMYNFTAPKADAPAPPAPHGFR